MWQVARCDTFACVGNFHLHHIAAWLSPHEDCAVARRMSQRITDQIMEYTLEFRWAYQYRVNVAGNFADQPYTMLLSLGLKACQGV
jgi:hypothetical protein